MILFYKIIVVIKMIPAIIKEAYKNYKHFYEFCKAMDMLEKMGVIEYQRGERYDRK